MFCLLSLFAVVYVYAQLFVALMLQFAGPCSVSRSLDFPQYDFSLVLAVSVATQATLNND